MVPPRLYRTATASGKGDPSPGGPSPGKNPQDSKDDSSQPVFRQIPNRWLVTRRLRNPENAPGLKEFQSWVVESDAVHNIKTISESVDLESGVAPFVSHDGDPGDPNTLNAQTEVFLGQKFNLEDWPGRDVRQPLKGGLGMRSSNPLFGDNALHNCNVLSIIDNFSYKRNTSDKNPRDDNFSYLASAHCDYFVIGWHQDPARDPLNTQINSKEKPTLVSRLTKLLLKLSPAEAGDNGKVKDLPDHTRCLVHGAIYDVKYDFHHRADSLAEEGASRFTSKTKKGPLSTNTEPGFTKMEPLSIGTTPLDAILTFLEAHQNDADNTSIVGRKIFFSQLQLGPPP